MLFDPWISRPFAHRWSELIIRGSHDKEMIKRKALFGHKGCGLMDVNYKLQKQNKTKKVLVCLFLQQDILTGKATLCCMVISITGFGAFQSCETEKLHIPGLQVIFINH